MAVARQCPQQIRNTQNWNNWEVFSSALSMQQLRPATIKELLGELFSVRSVSRCYKQDKSSLVGIPHVEARSNTSTVALRVVGGDENGGLESETVKYGHESHGAWT
jgi:hypothetical protein